MSVGFVTGGDRYSVTAISHIVGHSGPIDRRLRGEMVSAVEGCGCGPDVCTRGLTNGGSELLNFVVAGCVGRCRLLLFHCLGRFTYGVKCNYVVHCYGSKFRRGLRMLERLRVEKVRIYFDLFLLSRRRRTCVGRRFEVGIYRVRSPRVQLGVVRGGRDSICRTIYCLTRLNRGQVKNVFYVSRVSSDFLVTEGENFLGTVDRVGLSRSRSLVNRLRKRYRGSDIVSIVRGVFMPRGPPATLFYCDSRITVRMVS